MRRDSAAIEVGIEGDLVPPQYRLAVLQDHPRFDEAMRLCAVNSIDMHSRGRVMGWLMSDRTLAVVALAAVCLDADMQADDLRSCHRGASAWLARTPSAAPHRATSCPRIPG